MSQNALFRPDLAQIMAALFPSFRDILGQVSLLPLVLDALACFFFIGGLVALLLLRRVRAESMPVARQNVRGIEGRFSLVAVVLVPVVLLFVTGLDLSVYAPSLASTAAGTPSSSTVLPVIHPGALSVVTDASYPPQSYVDTNGQFSGFDIDLIRAVADNLKLNLRISNDTNFASLANDVQQNSADVVISAYAFTPGNVKGLPFIFYLNPGEVLLVAKNSQAKVHFTGWSDLCGHAVGVLQGSNEDTFLRNIQCPIGSALKLDEATSADGVVQDLVRGKVDVTYQDSPMGTWYTDFSPYKGQVKVLGTPLRGTPEGMLVRNNQRLFLALQQAYLDLVQQGTYLQLLTKWHLTADAL